MLLWGSPYLIDGDEAILGLMAKHLSEGKGFPLYFYGQSFGLSVVECVAGALFFLLLGVSETSLKLSILFLWSLAWALMVLAAKNSLPGRVWLFAGLLLIFLPGWFSWSLRARGYHVGAFLLFSLVLWLTTLSKPRLRGWRVGLDLQRGLATGLLYLTNHLWFVASLPFVVLSMKGPFARRAFFTVAGFAVSLITIRLLSGGRMSTFFSPDYLSEPDFLEAFRLLPGRIFTAISGSYVYVKTDSGPATTILCWLWVGASVVAAVLFFGRKLKDSTWQNSAACLAGILLLAIATTFIKNDLVSFRYFLPLITLLPFFLSIELAALDATGWGWLPMPLLAVFIILGGFAATEADLGSDRPPALLGAVPERQALDELIEQISAAGVQHVYCLNAMVQWNITFRSKEEVIARSRSDTDRFPAYPRAVDLAFRDGEPVGLVGAAYSRPEVSTLLTEKEFSNLRVREIRDSYFWISDPPLNLLKRLGFQFNGSNNATRSEATTLAHSTSRLSL